jgi:hypothetical protein
VTRPRALLTENDHLQFRERYKDRYEKDPFWFEKMQDRRQGWFNRIYRYFDLVRFEDVADWRFSVAKSIPREETFRNLLHAIRHGEFGIGPKIDIVYMPHRTGSYPVGTLFLRTYVGQVLQMMAENNVDCLRDLYARRDLVRRWFQTHGLKSPPPWLEVPSAGSDQTPTNAAVAVETGATQHPQRDQTRPQRPLPEARREQVFKSWREQQMEGYIPTAKEDFEYMKTHGVSRAEVRKLRKKFPTRERGRRKSRDEIGG